MGRGDKKTRQGKIAIGSFGKSRPHHVKKAAAAPVIKTEAETDAAKEKTKKPSA